MRGKIDPDLFKRFAKATQGFPPTARNGSTAQQVFEASYQEFYDIDTGKTPFPRAKGWRAYALALSVYEGWILPKPDQAMDAKMRIDNALEWAKDAVKADDTDHDLYWALADVHLIRGAYFQSTGEPAKAAPEFDSAVTSFDQAITLSADERHPSLFAEAAAAYMHRGGRVSGDHLRAEEYFKRARREPDWHHWMNGIFLFIRAGRAGDGEETLLDLALDELKATHVHPDEDLYQHEIQLILAAAYLKKSQLIKIRAMGEKDTERKQQLNAIADRHKKNADTAIKKFLDKFKWKRADANRAVPFYDSVDKNYFGSAVDELLPP